MMYMCPERQRLWAEYDIALTNYIAAVDHLVQRWHSDSIAGARRARQMLILRRTAIREHSAQHGCDGVYPSEAETRIDPLIAYQSHPHFREAATVAGRVSAGRRRARGVPS
jgi:hypothetical protein